MSLKINIFEYREYKKYLNQVLPVQGTNRGQRTKLAEYLNCQSAFVSQVLKGNGDFNLEHALLISEFLRHNDEERNFFILLVHFERAGSTKLKEFFKKQIDAEIKKREVVAHRLAVASSICLEDQTVYYSSWLYAGLHILCSIPGFQQKEELARYLRVRGEILDPYLDFLCKAGLVEYSSGHYKIGTKRIHLGKESPLLAKHHQNWRLQCLKALETPDPDNLHYSSVVSLSKGDIEKIKELLLQALEKSERLLKDSPEEELFSLCLDFFKV